jgi:hypothetical protein
MARLNRWAVLAFFFPLACASAHAEPIAPLQPMSFLAGQCWKGQFASTSTTDTHCFEWMHGGAQLRDVHTVRAPGRADYVGETVYYFDSATKQVHYLYVENGGGIGRGQVEVTAGGLSFPGSEYVSNGAITKLRVQWTRVGEDGYEAWTEVLAKDTWATMFKLTLKRVAKP